MASATVSPPPASTTPSAQAQARRETLRRDIAERGSLVVAYSGGVDSAFLLHEAHAVLGAGACRGVMADSASLPRHELEEALELSRRFGWDVEVISTDELSDPRYAANPINRCYFCKAELFAKLTDYAQSHRLAALAYGENADDAGDFRPGQKAAQEFAVLAPLREAGLTKADIRALSAEAGLPTAGKAAQPCLASRLPHGQVVTREALARVEAGETLLREAGFSIYRVRHDGETARVLVAPAELPRLADEALRAELAEGLRRIGFAEVHFDAEGYRGASLR